MGGMRATARVEGLVRRCSESYTTLLRIGLPNSNVNLGDERKNPCPVLKDTDEHLGRDSVRQGLLYACSFRVCKESLDGLDFKPKDIQAFLDNVERFKDSTDEMFGHVGYFVSAMLEIAFERLGPDVTLEFDLPGKGPVHAPEHYMSPGDTKESIWPETDDHIRSYYRTNLLLIYLGARHSIGTLVLNGNLGSFFAEESSGGHIILNGECGWRSGSYLKGARITINGIAGHYFLETARSGLVSVNSGIVNGVRVNGQVRSLAFRHTSEVEFYLNGQRIYAVIEKKKFGSVEINTIAYTTTQPDKKKSK
jgi:hypothetical protein